MNITVDGKIFSKYGDVKVGALKVADFNCTDEFIELSQAKAENAISKFNEMISGKTIEEFEGVNYWKKIFSQMGGPASRVSSIENLYRLIDEWKALPQIHPIVDYYNAISCMSGIPMGAYDTDKIVGNITVREAAKGEFFFPMGLNQVEKTKNEEVIYADDERVTCRYWNNKDSDLTKVDAGTKNVVFVFDVSPEVPTEYLEGIIGDMAAELKTAKVSDRIYYGIIDKDNRTIEF